MSAPEDGIKDITANVSVTPPTAAPAGGWAKYQLRACPAAGCPATWFDCAPVSADGSATVCTLSGLSQATAYTVQAVATSGSTISAAGTSSLTTRIS